LPAEICTATFTMGSSASAQKSRGSVTAYPKHPSGMDVQDSSNFPSASRQNDQQFQQQPAPQPESRSAFNFEQQQQMTNNNGHANGSAPSAPPQEDEAVTQTTMDADTLLRYVEIEKEINRLEAMNSVEHLQIKWDELKALEEEIQRLTAVFESRKEQTRKEKQDVDEMQQISVNSFIADKAAFDERMSREQEEFVTALNKQEVAQRELESAVRIRESARQAVKELHEHANRLQGLYRDQDVMLAAIFDGKYGSELEFRLEREHDATSDRQQRIAAAKARWQAGRLLIHHACAQLGHGVKQWETCGCMPPQDMQRRYAVATETRNYLVAACANLRNSQNYLKGIDFPYCKLDEVVTLERATSNIFTDVATLDRHMHAMSVYRAMFQRAGALLQWFDTVINKTIDRDLLSATEELFEKKRLLRTERVRLIKQKLEELLGPQAAAEAGLDEDANLTDARRLQEQLETLNQDEMQKLMTNVQVVQPEGVQPSPMGIEATPEIAGSKKRSKKSRKGKEKSNDEAAAEGEGSAETPQASAMESMPKIDAVSLKDLAPPPSQDQLFGDIDSIKKQYEIDMEEYQRAQELNRTRVERGLQEKLAARKTRKARRMAQEQETEKLLNDSVTA
ncbi:hypothetical protein BOX15_Mlig023585g1, partial [Macrostomum lignano]